MLKGLFSFFENLIPPFVEAEGRKLPENLMGFVAFFSHGLYRFFFAAALLNTLIAAGEALFFLSLGYIVDWTASTSPSDFLSAHGSSLLIMLLVAGVILPVSSVLHSLLIHQTLSSNYSMLVRFQLHSILLGKSMSFFSEEYSGALANKVMQTSLAVRTAVMKLLDVSVHLIVYIATMLIMLSSSSFMLCLPLIVWLMVYIVSLVVFIPRLSQCSKDVSVRRSKMVGRIVDSYTNILTVKVFGGHGKEADFTREAMDEYRKGEYGSLRILTLFDISVQMMNYTMLIVLVMISLWLWSNYLTTPGVIAIAIAVAIRLINMSRWIMWEAGVVFENLGMIYDGMKTISRPNLLCDPKNPKDLHGFSDEIEFKDVTFAYKGKKAVFEGLNLKIKKGEKIGIAGSSGAGKSTLVSLLLRLFDVDSGSITIDGTDIRDLKQDDLRELFSLVSQDQSLLHRSVLENILYGASDDVTDDRIKEVLKQTDSEGFIENLSDYRGGSGVNSMVGDRGVKLSGGQRQRIALSRVLLKDAPILILDEATSSLDSKSEKTVVENLNSIMEGRTVIAIAHRLSTLRSMDKIIVMDKGRIVETGTHDELIEKDGFYRSLWELQTDGYVKSD